MRPSPFVIYDIPGFVGYILTQFNENDRDIKFKCSYYRIGL